MKFCICTQQTLQIYLSQHFALTMFFLRHNVCKSWLQTWLLLCITEFKLLKANSHLAKVGQYCKSKIADTHLYKYCSTQLKQSPQRENTHWRPIHIEVNRTSKRYHKEMSKKVFSAGGQTKTSKHYKLRSFSPTFGVNTFIAFSQCKPTVAHWSQVPLFAKLYGTVFTTSFLLNDSISE